MENTGKSAWFPIFGKLQKYEKSTKYFFLNFLFILFSLYFNCIVLVFVAQIDVSNKSYGCLEGIHAN